MQGSLGGFFAGMLLMLSIILIVSAILLFWVDIGGKLGRHARKISIVLGTIGWAIIFLTLMPIT